MSCNYLLFIYFYSLVDTIFQIVRFSQFRLLIIPSLYFTILTFSLELQEKCQNCETYTKIWYLKKKKKKLLCKMSKKVRITVFIFHSVVEINFHKTCFPLKRFLFSAGITHPSYSSNSSPLTTWLHSRANQILINTIIHTPHSSCWISRLPLK